MSGVPRKAREDGEMGTAGQPHQLTVYRLVEEAGDFTKVESSQADARTQSVDIQ